MKQWPIFLDSSDSLLQIKMALVFKKRKREVNKKIIVLRTKKCRQCQSRIGFTCFFILICYFNKEIGRSSKSPTLVDLTSGPNLCKLWLSRHFVDEINLEKVHLYKCNYWSKFESKCDPLNCRTKTLKLIKVFNIRSFGTWDVEAVTFRRRTKLHLLVEW